MADAKKTVVIEAKTKGVEESTKEVNELSGGVAGLTDNIKVMGVSVGQVRGALRGFTNGFKGLNTVLKASPIFLLVGVITAIASVFTRTQKGIDEFNKRWEQLSATIDVLLGRLTDVGNAFVSLFQGDFSGFVDGLAKSVSGLGEEIKGAVEDAGALEELRQQADRNEIERVKRRAELNALIAESRALAADEAVDAATRLEAIRGAQQATIELNRLNAEAAAERLRIAQEELRTTPEQLRTREQQLAISQAEAEVQQVRINNSNIERRILADVNRLVREIQADRAAELKAVEEGAPARKELNADLQTTVKLRQGDLDIIKEQNAELEKKVSNEAKAAKAQEEAALQRARSEQALIIGLSQLNQDSARAAAAIQQGLAIQDSFRALISGWATGFTIFDKIANVALIAGQVAGLVRNVSSIQIGGQSISERFALGGMVYGNSHANGGEKFAVGGRVVELEGGEAVINRRSTAMFKPLLSALNVAGGGRKFQRGGQIGFNSADIRNIANQVQGGQPVQVPVLVVEDLDTTQNRVQTRENRGSFPGN